MTRAEQQAQNERQMEKLARFNRAVAEHLYDYRANISLPCPSCGQMIYPSEKCPVCVRGTEPK